MQSRARDHKGQGFTVPLVDQLGALAMTVVKMIREGGPFGTHAIKKFEDVKQYGMVIPREQVEEAVRHPDRVEPGNKGRKIATRGWTQHLVLRVVYRESDEAFDIVTFYPARRSRYEAPI